MLPSKYNSDNPPPLKKTVSWKKWIFGIISVVILSFIATIIYGFLRLPEVIKDAYAQWTAADLVIAYKKENGKMPQNWTDLEPYAKYEIMAGFTFSEIQQRIEIIFPRLEELEKIYPDKESIPEIITAKSGSQAHYSGTEPNELVNQYVSEQK